MPIQRQRRRTRTSRTSRTSRNTKRRGGATARHPPTIHPPSCGAHPLQHSAPTCSPPIDVSSYKNPCVAGALPLDNAFLSTPMKGGRQQKGRYRRSRGGRRSTGRTQNTRRRRVVRKRKGGGKVIVTVCNTQGKQMMELPSMDIAEFEENAFKTSNL